MLVYQTSVPWTFQASGKGGSDLSYGWRKSEMSDLSSHAELCPSSGSGPGLLQDLVGNRVGK